MNKVIISCIKTETDQRKKIELFQRKTSKRELFMN